MQISNIKNRVLLIILLIFILFLAACNDSWAVESENSDEETHNLIVSHFQPGNHPIQTNILEGLASDLNEQTDGRIDMEFYPSNTLGDAGSQYDMAVTREADIALSVYGYSSGRFPLVTVMELPFLAESAEHASEILMTLYEEFPEMQEEHADTHPLFLFSAEPAQIISKDFKIETPDDMKGLRVRSPSQMGNDIIEALGATPISMPMGDVYESLERGVIDAAVVPFETLYNYSFHEVTNYITIGDFSATPFFSVMSEKTYEDFSEADQQTLDNLIGKDLAKEAGSIYDADGEIGLETAIENGAEVIELEGDALIPWEEALEPMVNEWIEQRTEEGYPAQEIYDRAMELKEELSDREED
ncbi:TRAP transporter substrate-binding protein [Oceanobacillus oncorhynchi]|uniref:TRAP transporter substrate-binding protein n=1 Tax=Oceanobacillus oncorhynchi TaxID=545501 RepID=UPI002F96E7D3